MVAVRTLESGDRPRNRDSTGKLRFRLPTATGIMRYGPGVRWGLSISLSEELADPGLVAEVAVDRRGSRVGRRVRVGPPVEPDVGSVRRPVRHAGGDRGGDRAGADRDDGGGAAAAAAAARRSGDDLARSPVGWPDGARPRPRRRQLRRVLGVRRAGDGRPRSRRALDAGIDAAHADARRRPRAGRRRPGDDAARCATATGADLDRRAGWAQRRAAARRPPRAGGTGAGGCRRLDARTRHRRPARRGADRRHARRRAGRRLAPRSEALATSGATWCIPEILPGATAAEALAAAANPPG